MTGVNRAWGKSTTPIPDFPQALFTRVNIPAKGLADGSVSVAEIGNRDASSGSEYSKIRNNRPDSKLSFIWFPT